MIISVRDNENSTWKRNAKNKKAKAEKSKERGNKSYGRGLLIPCQCAMQ